MVDTGVWVKARYDDGGNLTVTVSTGAEGQDGEACRVNEDVTESLPADLRRRVAAVLGGVLEACGDRPKDRARRPAGPLGAGVTALEFAGSLKPEGQAK